MADNKSSLVQIAQAVLDEATQTIKVSGTVSTTAPVGGATEAKQDSQITELQAIKGYVDGIESKLDTLNSQTDNVETTLLDIKTNTVKLDYANRVRLVYSVTNVTVSTPSPAAAWVQLLASVGATAIKEIEIFDSSGETLELGVGAPLGETSKVYVIPGGNGRIPMQIAANSRLAIRAVSATANSGEIVINLYG